MPEIQRKMLRYLSAAEAGDYVPLKAIAARVGVNVNTIRYHYCKLRHRIESRMGPGGGYRLIR